MRTIIPSIGIVRFFCWVVMSTDYFFDVTLPYSLEVPEGEAIRFRHKGLNGVFVHLEKIKVSSSQGIEFSSHIHIPADKYGVFNKSRIRIILCEEVLSKIHSSEKDKTRKVFDKLNEYVALSFGLPETKLKPFVVGSINKILCAYRVISQEWHSTPVTSKDLFNFTLSKQQEKKTEFLSTMPDAHRVMQGENKLFAEKQMTLLRKAVTFEATMSPLLILEADIHDKATQGEFMTAIMLIALLLEEAIKEHIVQYISLSKKLPLDKAKLKLIKSNGHSFGIGELLDKPKKGKFCFVDKLIYWKPFLDDEYKLWVKNVRELRNNIMHANEKDISHQQIINAWQASVDFIYLSCGKFIKKLYSEEVELVHSDLMKFYLPVSKNVFTQGLIGDFSNSKT